MKNKKFSFTLLEIMVAIAILTMISSTLIWQVHKSIKEHRFQSEVAQLFIALQEAQVLALTFQTDLCLHISQEKGSFLYHFSTHEPFSSFFLDRDPVKFGQVKKITQNGKVTKKTQFEIYHTGCIEPRGMLKFSSDKSTLWFDFQHGHLLKFCYHSPERIALALPEKPTGK